MDRRRNPRYHASRLGASVSLTMLLVVALLVPSACVKVKPEPPDLAPVSPAGLIGTGRFSSSCAVARGESRGLMSEGAGRVGA